VSQLLDLQQVDKLETVALELRNSGERLKVYAGMLREMEERLGELALKLENMVDEPTLPSGGTRPDEPLGEQTE
jgi:hypothetical protein